MYLLDRHINLKLWVAVANHNFKCVNIKVCNWWNKTIKLERAVKFKITFCLGPYILYMSKKTTLSCLLDLHINWRHTIQLAPHEQKIICSRCNTEEIDDEIHFLFNCNTFTVGRTELLIEQ